VSVPALREQLVSGASESEENAVMNRLKDDLDRTIAHASDRPIGPHPVVVCARDKAEAFERVFASARDTGCDVNGCDCHKWYFDEDSNVVVTPWWRLWFRFLVWIGRRP
jgi:hypothetical protein